MYWQKKWLGNTVIIFLRCSVCDRFEQEVLGVAASAPPRPAVRKGVIVSAPPTIAYLPRPVVHTYSERN